MNSTVVRGTRKRESMRALRASLPSAHVMASPRCSAAQTDAQITSNIRDRWDQACSVELRRSEAYLAQHSHRIVNGSLPIPQLPHLNNLNATLASIEALLSARGVLCSPEHPCSVERLPTNRNRFQICLAKQASDREPLRMCEAAPLPGCGTSGFGLKKACTHGDARHCFVFDEREIWNRLRTLKATMKEHAASKSSPTSRSANASSALGGGYKRCAVVLSGHALRCGRSWAPLIDSSYYSAVFRTNWVGRNEASFAGRRVDF